MSSFSSGPCQVVGHAPDLEIKLTGGDFTNERQARVLAVLGSVAGEIAREFGGYLAITINGNVNDYEGGIGDHLNLQVNSILPPPAPVQDAGLEAAGGSARNFPPEASTAAPATEDNSPPATQEPIPQPAIDLPLAPLAPEEGAESVASLVLDGQTETVQLSSDPTPISESPSVSETAQTA